MRNALLALTLIALAAPAAGAVLLSIPVACELGKTCYVQQYMDHDPSDGFQDFQCGKRSYNTHKGTDFATRTTEIAKQGVDVLAANAGTVLGVRDGMEDIWSGNIDVATIKGRECGNGLVIDHGEGWQTQYCHLRKGSLAVKKGDRVEVGTRLGQIGMSGQTSFAHLHLSVRKDGKQIDPFAPNGQSCDAPITETLWKELPLFQAGGILEIGFSDRMPDFADIKMGTASNKLTRISPALISYIFMFASKKGDTVEVTFTGPGKFSLSKKFEQTKSQARSFRAIGKNRRAAPWPAGTYKTQAKFVRAGKVIDEKSATFEIAR